MRMSSYSYDSAEVAKAIHEQAQAGNKGAQFVVAYHRKQRLKETLWETYHELMEMGLMDAAASVKVAIKWI